MWTSTRWTRRPASSSCWPGRRARRRTRFPATVERRDRPAGMQPRGALRRCGARAAGCRCASWPPQSARADRGTAFATGGVSAGNPRRRHRMEPVRQGRGRRPDAGGIPGRARGVQVPRGPPGDRRGADQVRRRLDRPPRAASRSSMSTRGRRRAADAPAAAIPPPSRARSRRCCSGGLDRTARGPGASGTATGSPSRSTRPAMPSFGRSLPLRDGTWDLFLRRAGAADGELIVPGYDHSRLAA